MRYIIFFSILCLTTLSINAQNKKTLPLQFNQNGQLLSDLPNQLIPSEYDSIKISINHDVKFINQRIVSSVNWYHQTLKNLNNLSLIDSLLENFLDGQPVNNLERTKNILHSEITKVLVDSNLYAAYSEIEKIELIQSINQLCPYSYAIEDNTLIPNIEALIRPEYNLYLTYLDSIKSIIKLDTIDLKIQPKPTTTNSSTSYISIPSNCSILQFKLVRVNNYYQKIKENETKRQRIIAAIDTSITTSIIQIKEEIKIKNNAEAIYLSTDKINPTDTVENPLKSITQDLKDITNIARKNLVNLQKLRLLGGWITKGSLQFNYFTDFDLDSLKTIKENALIYQLFLDNKLKKLINQNDLTPATFQLEYDSLITTIRLNKKKITELTEHISSKINRPVVLFKDSLLYDKGLLFPSKHKNIFMLNHNGQNEYLLMNNRPKTEISENQKMHISIHNELPQKTTKAKIEVEPIKNDLPPATIALVKNIDAITNTKVDFNNYNVGKGAQGILSNFDSLSIDTSLHIQRQVSQYINVVNNLTDSLSKIMELHNTILAQFIKQKPYTPLPQPDIDKTPNYITKTHPHEVIDDPPLFVKYDLKSSDGKKILSDNHAYRIYKNYKIRLKAGPILSFLDNSTYNLDKTKNTVVVNRQRRGLDGTIGVQYYLGRPKNIQNAGWQQFKNLPVFLYGGILLKDKPFENYAFGIGIEPIYGFAIMGGWHLGKVDRLDLNPLGQLSIKNKWKGDIFLSLATDLIVFNKIGGLLGVNNPFK